MRFVLTRDAAEFAARAAHFLAARPERNVLATLVLRIGSGRFPAAAPLFAYADSPTGLVAAALRIYADVGFRAHAAFEEHALIRPTTPASRPDPPPAAR